MKYLLSNYCVLDIVSTKKNKTVPALVRAHYSDFKLHCFQNKKVYNQFRENGIMTLLWY